MRGGGAEMPRPLPPGAAARPGADVPRGGALAVFLVFLRLGLSSFGGPVAHLGYFHEAFVVRRRWLSEAAYADLVALCQFLPGPASSQVGIALGLLRAGLPGALAAWIGFTLPSALVLALLGLGVSAWEALPGSGLLHGLKLAAVAVVAQAVWSMGRSLCPDAPRATIAAAACALLVHSGAWMQAAVIAGAAGLGFALLRNGAAAPDGQEVLHVPLRRRTGLVLLLLCALLLAALPLLVQAWPARGLAMFDVFYRAGALVFGGGHVVLPLLQAGVVPAGWVGEEVFLAGYGAAQAVPGPLFTFAAFLGAVAGGWPGALLALVAIFLPALLLVLGALPFWERLRRDAGARAALAGVNAAVVGLLLAALYDPVWTGSVRGAGDFAQVVAAVVALTVWRLPPWAVVLASAALGWLRVSAAL